MRWCRRPALIRARRVVSRREINRSLLVSWVKWAPLGAWFSGTPVVVLLVLLVLYAVLVGFTSFGWLGMIGGIAVGALSGAVLAYAPRQNRWVIQLVGMLAVMVVCLGAVVLRIAVL